MRSPAQPLPAASVKQRLVSVLAGEVLSPPAVWLMRQAGRYLPEYREVRASVGDFLELCYTPALAAEVTLQPIRRYGFDAAILFSDILVVPDALGQGVRFVEGEGPRLDAIASAAELSRLDPVGTGEQVRPHLRNRGAPAPGSAARDGADRLLRGAVDGCDLHGRRRRARPTRPPRGSLAYRDPETFARLIDIVTEASVEYLDGQVRAGADVLQIFDSWAGNLPDGEFDAWVVAPTRKIVAELKRRHPGTPIIGFPRGAGANAERYVRQTGVEGLGCDTAMPLREMRALADRGRVAVQGNLDPLLLAAGWSATRCARA